MGGSEMVTAPDVAAKCNNVRTDPAALKFSCPSGSPLDGMAPTFPGRIPSARRNLPTALGLRLIPASASMLPMASVMLAGECLRK
jgi:hypothetical protein